MASDKNSLLNKNDAQRELAKDRPHRPNEERTGTEIVMLTFHYAHNYGAVLQAYALKRSLEAMGRRVFLANYQNRAVAGNYRRKLRVNLFRKHWLNPANWLELLDSIRVNRCAREDWELQWRNFKDFIGRAFGEQRILSFDELSRIDCDAFIVGSDQVWEKNITGGFDRAYFLDFQTAAKKISYAASMGRWNWSKDEQKKAKVCLSDFHALSVREKPLERELEKLLGRDVETVLDPSLLVDISEYDALESKEPQEDEDFVFAYFIAENEALMRCAKAAANSLGCKLIELHYYKQPSLKGHNQVAYIGPAEFLWYMKRAQFVLTNSFHGTAFSILNNKPFYSVCKRGHNQRIEQLLGSLQISERRIEGPEDCDVRKPIDYDAVMKELETLREGSLRYLSGALG
jgi:hypothetical protein